MYLLLVAFSFKWFLEDYVYWPANNFHPAVELERTRWGGGRGEGGAQGSRWGASSDSLVAFVCCPVEGRSSKHCDTSRCCSLPAITATPRGGGHLLFNNGRGSQSCFDSLGDTTCLQSFLGQRQNLWRERFSGDFSLRGSGGDPFVLGGFSGETVLTYLLWRLFGSCFLIYNSAFNSRCWGREIIYCFACRSGNTAASLQLSTFHILGLDPNKLWICRTRFSALMLVAVSGSIAGGLFW